MVGVAYGSSPPPSDVSVRGAKTGFVAKSFTIGTAESTITIPTGALSFQLRVNGNQVLTISESVGGTAVAATSAEIPKFNTWHQDGLNLNVDLDIHLKSNQAATTVELIYWL
jgi:hypothetical protein